jgi:hypothetical protein
MTEQTTLGLQIAVTNLKEEAIKLGFDWPTQDISTVDATTLYNFYLEVEDFIEFEKQMKLLLDEEN